MLNIKAFGKRVQSARKELKMPAETLAEKAGISVYYVREIERGAKYPSLSTFVDLANALNKTADELLCDSVDRDIPLILNDVTKEIEHLSVEEIARITAVVRAMLCK
ncbi:MAG: helix-turn-helix transcriptional regulator [Bacillota bacterium]|nr:helix-turn-helix transcriptional regulator [Bacillota bacterium]